MFLNFYVFLMTAILFSAQQVSTQNLLLLGKLFPSFLKVVSKLDFLQSWSFLAIFVQIFILFQVAF